MNPRPLRHIPAADLIIGQIVKLGDRAYQLVNVTPNIDANGNPRPEITLTLAPKLPDAGGFGYEHINRVALTVHASLQHLHVYD